MKLKALLCFTVLLTYYQGNAQNPSKLLAEKVKKLNDMTAKKSVIPLNLSKFKEFVKSPPRDYSFIVMFTALSPSRRCAICPFVYEEYLVVANSFRYSSSYNNKLFFGLVDFDEGYEIFQTLRLHTAPVVMHFPAKGKPKPADTMDFESGGTVTETISKWIRERTDIQIKIFQQPDYYSEVALVLLIVLGAGFLYIRQNNFDFLCDKQVWAIVAVTFCLAMISGQMWNRIKQPPFFHMTKNGPVLMSGSHGQFWLESFIVIVLNVAVVVGLVLMIEGGGGVRGTEVSHSLEEGKRRYKCVLGMVLVCVFFSLLLSLFKAKTPGYPYSFIFR